MTIIEKIKNIAKEKNAAILAHNYQLPEIQDIADFTGDSLGLSIQASKTNADIIVFCGVMFMAETAKILSPQKMVLIPDKDAGCPMADMITSEKLIEIKNKIGNPIVVCYVNSTADIKAISDYCCTSSNAVDIVNSIPDSNRPILFIPDRSLGEYVKFKTGKNIILWPGYCPTHHRITKDDILALKKQYPDAVTLVHPECVTEVVDLADEILSTGGMLKYVENSNKNEFIIATEAGLVHALQKGNPDKKFYNLLPHAICPNMKKITLDKLLVSLEDETYKVELSNDIIEKARIPINRMVG